MLDHSFGGVAGNYRDSFAGEEKGVFAGATVQLQNVIPGSKRLRENIPDGFSLSASDERSGKQIVVPPRQLVEG
jgi:hypothetical protein